MNILKEQKKHGFTIVELLITIFVLTIGILAVFVLVEQPLHFAVDSMNRLSADYFAQSGLEQVRNQRDVYWLEGERWRNFCDDFKDTIDADPEYISGDSETVFNRTINVSCDNDKADVIINVSWVQRNRELNTSLQGVLYNWYE